MLPSPGDGAALLGLPAGNLPRAPLSGSQAQPLNALQTPDTAALNFNITEEELDWLASLTDDGGLAVAAEAATLTTLPAVSHSAEAPAAASQPQLLDQRLLHSAPPLHRAATAPIALNCWAVDAAFTGGEHGLRNTSRK